jgi:hypothetical protein
VPEPTLVAQVRNLRHRLTEIDEATRNLISAIELGTDPTVIHRGSKSSEPSARE